MADNDFIIENNTEEILIEAQEEQIYANETSTNIAIDVVASPTSKVEEPATVNITVQEVSGVPSGTRIVVNHTASDPNQHTIGAITGLRAELDDIKSLKTVYSNELLHANYYKWEGDNRHDEHGYFVSLVPGTSTIKICEGSDILGVSVKTAGFIGGQDATVARDNSYGLIVTSGLVYVRCELEIKVGDYVVSNAQGYAKKSSSDYGYKVLATEDKDGVTYAVIALGVQADVTNALGVHLNEIKEQVDANYKNIISAVNVANQAYDKAGQVEISNKEMSDKVDGALTEVGEMSTTVENIGTQVSQAQVTATQAKAIAESAATSAASMKQEAIDSANNAASQVGELTKTLEPLITWTDPETGNTGASYLANYINNGLATKAEIETVEEDLEHSKSAILQNAKSLQSLVVSIDKYSVGEYSTAHGLTLDQATNILEPGIIYAPTTSHKETYSYVDGEVTYEYEREFTPGYLYQWGQLSNGRYGWVTIDKFYNEIADINTSAPSVYFSAYEIAIATGDDYGYWYTSAETIYDTDGNITEEYEPYTLYKWDEGRWIAVATLKGNVNNRAISQIRQTANEISAEVTNARGSAATLGARISDTESEVSTLAAWTKDENGEQYNLASIKQTADEAGANISLVVAEKDGEKVVNAASIVAAINDGESTVNIDADHINFEAENYTVKANKIDFSGDDYIIQAKNVNFEAEDYNVISENINLKGKVTFESFDDDTRKQIEADSIDVQIWSSRGNIFKSGDVTSILTCHVFKAGVDITDTLPNSAFAWEKINNDGTVDTNWKATPYGNHVNAIQITSADVFSRAVFNCAVTI